MKLFKLEIGNTIAYAAADSMEDMQEHKAEVDAQFAYLPVEITEMELEGYEITVTPTDGSDLAPRRGGRPKKIV